MNKRSVLYLNLYTIFFTCEIVTGSSYRAAFTHINASDVKFENIKNMITNGDGKNVLYGFIHILLSGNNESVKDNETSINLTNDTEQGADNESISNTLSTSTSSVSKELISSDALFLSQQGNNAAEYTPTDKNSGLLPVKDQMSSIQGVYVQILDPGNFDVTDSKFFLHHGIRHLPPVGDKSLEAMKKWYKVVSGVGSTKSQSRLAFLDKMLQHYDKRVWPTYGTGNATNVKVNIYINSIGPVNAANMDYSLDIYLRQMWRDPRLRLSKYGIREIVTLNAEEIAENIWKPDIFFRNVKEASFHMVTVPNKLIKLSPSGKILFSMRLTLRLACRMSFRHYPLDTQHCKIILGSYAQTTDQVLIEWQAKDPIVPDQSLELPEFDVADVSYTNFTRDIDTGKFSFLSVTFTLVRQNGYHLIQTYMPTFLIVMISWVSFWLNVDATPARVTLGVTTLLTLTTVAYGVRMQLPPVSYVKAIDVWIGACSVMVFGALLEFTLVNYLSRSKLKPQELKHSINIFHKSKKFHLAQAESQPMSTESELVKNLKRARRVDRFCRVMFPFMFLVFNLIYWMYYLCVPDKFSVS